MACVPYQIYVVHNSTVVLLLAYLTALSTSGVLLLPQANNSCNSDLLVPLSASLLLFLKIYYIEKEMKWEALMGSRWLPVVPSTQHVPSLTHWFCLPKMYLLWYIGSVNPKCTYFDTLVLSIQNVPFLIHWYCQLKRLFLYSISFNLKWHSPAENSQPKPSSYTLISVNLLHLNLNYLRIESCSSHT